MKIEIQTIVNAPVSDVWQAWVTPEDITCWNFASEDWCCPSAAVDLRVGGKFVSRMEAKDGSFGFDFEGTYTEIELYRKIRYVLGDEREVTIDFIETPTGTEVIETFDAEDENSAEMQRQGWQSILDNFKNHVEAR